jgi:hypothetical protein
MIIHTMRKAAVGALDKAITRFLYALKRKNRITVDFPIYVPHSFSKRSKHLWKIKVLYPLLGKDTSIRRRIFSDVPIDVVIPTIEKDYDCLREVIESIRNYVSHPINRIYIVSRNQSDIADFCRSNNAFLVDEDSVLGYSKKRINYNFNGRDRSGWLFQQLLKLRVDTYTSCENILVVDSDTVFLRPKAFIYKGKTVFDQSDELHLPYFKVLNQLLGSISKPVASYIVHYMLFNRLRLREMRAEIEKNIRLPWDEAIILKTDYSSNSGFSEYETYGNYMKKRHRNEMIENYWFNTVSTPEEGVFQKTYSRHKYR